MKQAHSYFGFSALYDSIVLSRTNTTHLFRMLHPFQEQTKNPVIGLITGFYYGKGSQF